nr:MarR family transcriptional regulator [Novosphingobium sp. ERN07]
MLSGFLFTYDNLERNKQNKNSIDLGALSKIICDNYWTRSKLAIGFNANEVCWRILFEIFSAQSSGRPISVTDISISSDTPCATTIRWLAIMYDNGVVNRMPDRNDRRRIWIELTEIGMSYVTTVLQDLSKRISSTFNR